MARIGFGPGMPWAAVSQSEAKRLATVQEIRPLAIRVFLAALGHANRVGHAEFPDQELRRLLGVEHPASLSKAIATAKEWGLLHRTSQSRCIVLPRHFFQKEGQGTGSCRVHKVRTVGA
jgi:hypothetical protein